VREVPRRADHGGRGHHILVDPTHAVIDWANHEHDIEEPERPHPRGRRIQPDLGWPVDDPEEQRDAVDYALAVEPMRNHRLSSEAFRTPTGILA